MGACCAWLQAGRADVPAVVGRGAMDAGVRLPVARVLHGAQQAPGLSVTLVGLRSQLQGKRFERKRRGLHNQGSFIHSQESAASRVPCSHAVPRTCIR